jgi:hypothetical protein
MQIQDMTRMAARRSVKPNEPKKEGRTRATREARPMEEKEDMAGRLKSIRLFACLPSNPA